MQYDWQVTLKSGSVIQFRLTPDEGATVTDFINNMAEHEMVEAHCELEDAPVILRSREIASIRFFKVKEAS